VTGRQSSLLGGDERACPQDGHRRRAHRARVPGRLLRRLAPARRRPGPPGGQQSDAAERAGQLQQRIIEELEGRYYREVDVDALLRRGVKGMLEALDDPYTAYLSPQETRRLQEQTEGEYSGIGAALEKKNGTLLITRVFEGSPAAEAGLGPGDAIISVDGKSTADVAIETSISRIKGEPGTRGGARDPQGGRADRTTPDADAAHDPDPADRDAADHRRRHPGRLRAALRLLRGRGRHRARRRRAAHRPRRRGDRARPALQRRRPAERGGRRGQRLHGGRRGLDQGRNSPLEVYEAREDAETDVPVVVLVNEYTASASEIVAAALQDTRPGDGRRHDDLRQGSGADGRAARRRRQPQDHDGRLLHAARQGHQRAGRGARRAQRGRPGYAPRRGPRRALQTVTAD
jgi:hypothetical protein